MSNSNGSNNGNASGNNQSDCAKSGDCSGNNGNNGNNQSDCAKSGDCSGTNDGNNNNNNNNGNNNNGSYKRPLAFLYDSSTKMEPVPFEPNWFAFEIFYGVVWPVQPATTSTSTTTTLSQARVESKQKLIKSPSVLSDVMDICI